MLGRLFSHLLGEAGPMLHSYAYLCLLRILGVLSFSQLLFTLVRHGGPIKHFLIRYSGYSFFIFAAHFPLIELVKVVAQRVPGSDSAPGYFLMWLLIPLTTIALCVVGAKLLERLTPPVFNLLNGGRSAVAPPAVARPLKNRYANAAS